MGGERLRREYEEAMGAYVEAKKAKLRGERVPDFADLRNRAARAGAAVLRAKRPKKKEDG